LKFRNLKNIENTKFNKFTSKKLELKIRNGRTQLGVENWNKIFAKNINEITLLSNVKEDVDKFEDKQNNITLDNGQILNINIEEILNVIVSSLKNINFNDKEDYLASFQKLPIGFGLVFKERINSTTEEVLMKILTFYKKFKFKK